MNWLRLPHIPPAALGPIALAALIVLLAFYHLSEPAVHYAPASAVTSLWGMAQPEGGVPPGAPTPAPVLADSLQRIPIGSLNVIAENGLFSADDRARLSTELDTALDYVARRFGSGPNGRIEAYVGWEPGCGINGIAYTSDRLTQVFTCPDLPLSRAVNIMAHEFVHQLAHDRYGDAHLNADLILLEGTATWGAGDYWLAGAPGFGSFVRPWVESGSALPLAISYVGRSINDMNMLYYEWGSFVEFLIHTYGRDKFDALYVTGQGREPGSSDYNGVYGKSLDQLEQEWRAWVLTQ